MFPKKKGVFKWITKNCRALDSEQQKKILTEYIVCCLKFSRSSGERILFWFLSWGDYSEHPYGDFLNELLESYKINFYFGDTDWLDTKYFVEKIQEFKQSGGWGHEIVEQSGHQILLENPKGLVQGVRRFIDEESGVRDIDQFLLQAEKCGILSVFTEMPDVREETEPDESLDLNQEIEIRDLETEHRDLKVCETLNLKFRETLNQLELQTPITPQKKQRRVWSWFSRKK